MALHPKTVCHDKLALAIDGHTPLAAILEHELKSSPAALAIAHTQGSGVIALLQRFIACGRGGYVSLPDMPTTVSTEFTSDDDMVVDVPATFPHIDFSSNSNEPAILVLDGIESKPHELGGLIPNLLKNRGQFDTALPADWTVIITTHDSDLFYNTQFEQMNPNISFIQVELAILHGSTHNQL